MSQPTESSLTPMHDALLAALSQNSEKLAVAATELKESFHFTRRMKVTLVCAGVIAVLLLFAVVGMVFISLTNRQVLDTIKDCTNKTGQCARQGQQSQAAAVALILQEETRAFEIVTVCSSSPSTFSRHNAYSDEGYLIAIERCVNRLQSEQKAP